MCSTTLRGMALARENDRAPGEIDDVRREEESRGRRRYDSAARDEARRRRREELEWLRELARTGSQEDFAAGLNERGLMPGSPAYEDALRLLRDVQRRLSRP